MLAEAFLHSGLLWNWMNGFPQILRMPQILFAA